MMQLPKTIVFDSAIEKRGRNLILAKRRIEFCGEKSQKHWRKPNISYGNSFRKGAVGTLAGSHRLSNHL
jgi:hypothetical protein